jgi:hypothetical protein
MSLTLSRTIEAKQICELGGTSANLARAFDVDLDTIAFWQSVSKKFAAACKLAMDAAEQRLERALYERGTGYTETVDTIVVIGGKPMLARRKVAVRADPKAAKAWLDRRKAEADVTRKNPLEALACQLIGTALRPKEPN